MISPATTVLNAGNDHVSLTVLHYWKKAAITRSVVLGTEERALCGTTGQTSGAQKPGNTSRRTRNVVCPLCQLVMDGIKGNQ